MTTMCNGTEMLQVGNPEMFDFLRCMFAPNYIPSEKNPRMRRNTRIFKMSYVVLSHRGRRKETLMSAWGGAKELFYKTKTRSSLIYCYALILSYFVQNL